MPHTPRSPRLRARAALCALALLPAAAAAQRPLNLDFEMPSAALADQPWGWSRGWSAFAAGPAAQFALDETQRKEGTRSLRIVASDTAADAPPRGLMLQLPGAFAHGRRLTLTGWIRAERLRGRALLTLEAWGDRVVPAADTGRVDASDAPTDWRRFDLVVDVPSDPSIHSIVIMPAVQGHGTAWFDGLVFTVDGRRMDQLGSVEAPSASQLQRLAARSAPLPGDGPGADLAAFDRIVGAARVIGLGESTHGTREFFQLKHRLIAHLVRTQGIDVFALEANERAAARLDAWVRGGPGTAREALRSVFAVWNTEEMVALLEWMRAHNATATRPVRIIGYDMQDHREPADSLLAFLGAMDPGLQRRVAERTAEYRAAPSFATPQVDEATRARWLAQAEDAFVAVSAQRAAWLAQARDATDSLRAERAVHDADLLRQAARLNASLASPDRDSLMAANLDWALRTTARGSRVIVWAHDVHVSRGGDPRRSFNGGAQMGAHVARTFGHEYRAFSLLTRVGDYTATRSFTDHTLIAARGFTAPAGSVEAMLGSLPRPAGAAGLIVDVRVPEGDAQLGWLWRPRPVRHIGYAAYDYGFEMSVVMPLEFDGILFVDRTTASRPLRAGPPAPP